MHKSNQLKINLYSNYIYDSMERLSKTARRILLVTKNLTLDNI